MVIENSVTIFFLQKLSMYSSIKEAVTAAVIASFIWQFEAPIPSECFSRHLRATR